MNKGWYGEKNRHRLASKGIKSVRKHDGEDFLNKEYIEIKYDNGYTMKGNIVFLTHDLDGDWDDKYVYDSPEDLIRYVQELYENNDNDFLTSEPKTLEDAIKYLKEYRIEVRISFDGLMISPNGTTIALSEV